MAAEWITTCGRAARKAFTRSSGDVVLASRYWKFEFRGRASLGGFMSTIVIRHLGCLSRRERTIAKPSEEINHLVKPLGYAQSTQEARTSCDENSFQSHKKCLSTTPRERQRDQGDCKDIVEGFPRIDAVMGIITPKEGEGGSLTNVDPDKSSEGPKPIYCPPA